MAAIGEEGAFHDGERALQERTGERAQAVRNGAMIAGSIMEPARTFLSAQRMLIVGSRGADGYPRVSIVFGDAGFVNTPQNDLVEIELDPSFVDREEAVLRGLRRGAEVGLLAIDLERRRRFRVNGFVERADDTAILVRVREAYPNCPKYIHRRRLISVEPRPAGGAARQSGQSLDAAHRAVIEASDLFFMASMHPQRGADVSHRGGPAGFVRVLNDRTLRFPDYAGNAMFNSLGNLMVDDRVGLAFVDFARTRVLRISGRADIQFDAGVAAPPAAGTRRFVEVSIDAWSDLPLDAAAHWEDLERAG